MLLNITYLVIYVSDRVHLLLHVSRDPAGDSERDPPPHDPGDGFVDVGEHATSQPRTAARQPLR